MKVEGTKRTTPNEALEILEEKEENEELKQEQKLCLEFLRKHLKLKDKETVKELRKEIKEVGNLKDHHVDKVIEILPKSEDEVRALFSKERVKLSDDEIEKLIEICESVKE